MARVTRLLEGFCVIDKKPIPRNRLVKGSVTCSKECQTTRTQAQRALQELRECRYCGRPITPEEREAYRRFRMFEKKRPDLVYPEAFEKFKAENPDTATTETFAQEFWTIRRNAERGEE